MKSATQSHATGIITAYSQIAKPKGSVEINLPSFANMPLRYHNSLAETRRFSYERWSDGSA